MANHSGSHEANIYVDLSSFESFQIAMRATLNRQVQAAMADIETAYQLYRLNNPQAPGVQVSVNINYNIRPIDTHAGLNDNTARGSQANMAQDMARLSLDTDDSMGEGDTSHREEVNHQAEENVSQGTTLTNLATNGPVGVRLAAQNNPDEEAPPSLQWSVADLLCSLPPANLEDPPPDCPVCRESFPPTHWGEGDEAIVLDCNHIIGFKCIQNWICGGQNSCPLCRAAVFEPAVLTALADRVESSGLPRPVFRTPALNVAAETEEAAFGEEEMFIELTDEERSEAVMSQPMDRDDSLWDMLASEGEVSEEQFRLIPRVYALLREIRDTRERLRVLANR